jgi:phospholipase/lecithinase/hemolysin
MGKTGVQFGNQNDVLRRGFTTFATGQPDATAMLISAWDTFSRIPADPARYGFNPVDRNIIQGGSIWFDFVHPTSRVHTIFAGEIVQFLASQSSQA